MEIERHDGASAGALTEVVHALLAAEFAETPPLAEWRDGVWARHRARREFVLVVARVADAVVGIAWGYGGERGQWWTEHVLRALGRRRTIGDVLAIGHHLEIVELVVAPAHRRLGIGRALLAAVVAESPRWCALLGVAPTATAALALYAADGWRRVTALEGGAIVLGRRLVEPGPLPRHPCPACGYLQTDEPGSHDICGICFWQDDPYQLDFVFDDAGANNVSLVEAQRSYARIGATEERFLGHVTPPGAFDLRHPEWRPLEEADLPDPDAIPPRGPVETFYWWRPEYWVRHQPGTSGTP